MDCISELTLTDPLVLAKAVMSTDVGFSRAPQVGRGRAEGEPGCDRLCDSACVPAWLRALWLSDRK